MDDLFAVRQDICAIVGLQKKDFQFGRVALVTRTLLQRYRDGRMNICEQCGEEVSLRFSTLLCFECWYRERGKNSNDLKCMCICGCKLPGEAISLYYTQKKDKHLSCIDCYQGRHVKLGGDNEHRL